MQRTKKGQQTHTPNLIVIYEGFVRMPFGGCFWGDTAARIKHKNMHCTAVLDPRGCQHARTPRILRGFLNPRLSRRTLLARLSVVFRGLVLPCPPARNRKTRRTAWLRVAVSLVWLLGPRGAPEGARRGTGAPKGTQNTTDSVDFRKTIKNKLFDNVPPSRVQGPFWPTRAPDRTPITTDCCVLRRGIKSSPREPKGRKSVPGLVLKALKKLGPKTDTPKTMCFTSPNGLRAKIGGRAFSKNDTPLERQGTLQIRRGGGAPEGGGVVSTRARCFCKKP